MSGAARTAVFNDGSYMQRLVECRGDRVGRDAVRESWQLCLPSLRSEHPPADRLEDHHRADPHGTRDQRRVALPQRGSGGVFKCDIGAYEFVPWVVGQPLPRPASGTGKQAPTWSVTGGVGDTSGTYDAWSLARRLDLATRPTRPGETAIVSWALDDVTSTVRIVHAGIVVWPDDPQFHIAGAPVNLGHSAITDGYSVAPDYAQAFEGEEPNLDLAGKIVSTNVFTARSSLRSRRLLRCSSSPRERRRAAT